MENQKKSSSNKKNVSEMGRIIKQLRKAHGLTQEQTADILKIKRSAYAYYEKSTTPTVEIIKKLSVLFDVSVYFLMFGKEDPHSYPHSFNDSNETSVKVSDLKDDEKLLIMNYRLLNPQNKEKVYKEAKDLGEKQN